MGGGILKRFCIDENMGKLLIKIWIIVSVLMIFIYHTGLELSRKIFR